MMIIPLKQNYVHKQPYQTPECQQKYSLPKSTTLRYIKTKDTQIKFYKTMAVTT